jgi:hypothetical protein
MLRRVVRRVVRVVVAGMSAGLAQAERPGKGTQVGLPDRVVRRTRQVAVAVRAAQVGVAVELAAAAEAQAEPPPLPGRLRRLPEVAVAADGLPVAPLRAAAVQAVEVQAASEAVLRRVARRTRVAAAVVVRVTSLPTTVAGSVVLVV